MVFGVSKSRIKNVNKYFSQYGKIDSIPISPVGETAIFYHSASHCNAALEAGEEISGSSRRRHYIGEFFVDVDTEKNQVCECRLYHLQ